MKDSRGDNLLGNEMKAWEAASDDDLIKFEESMTNNPPGSFARVEFVGSGEYSESVLVIAGETHVGFLQDFVDHINAAHAKALQVAVKEAVEAEREACALLARGGCTNRGCSPEEHSLECPCGIGRAIRSRGGQSNE